MLVSVYVIMYLEKDFSFNFENYKSLLFDILFTEICVCVCLFVHEPFSGLLPENVFNDNGLKKMKPL